MWPRQSAQLFAPADNIIIRGVYANMVSFGTMLGSLYAFAILPRLGHERLQGITYMILQTAFIGSMASVGDDKTKAIVFIILVSLVNIPMTPLIYGMISLGLKDQADM
jgi:hypothetical protein